MSSLLNLRNQLPFLTLLGLLCASGLGPDRSGLATADTRAGEARAEEALPCASAAIRDIALDTLAEIDEIRVQLAPASPANATSLITVATEDTDRVVGMRDQRYKSIQFAPAMRSHEFRISLFPASMDSAGACVQSVELLSKGGSVVMFRP